MALLGVYFFLNFLCVKAGLIAASGASVFLFRDFVNISIHLFLTWIIYLNVTISIPIF